MLVAQGLHTLLRHTISHILRHYVISSAWQYYFANTDATGWGGWKANLIEVNGNLYAFDKAIQVSGLYNGAGTAANVQAGLEAMVAAGTAKKLGTIATK